jgi:hypothetical protein
MRIGFPLLGLVAASAIVGGCGFEQRSSVLVPTSVDSAPKTTVNGSNAAGSPSLVGVWTSGSLPTSSSCGSFQYQITSQTATTIAGTFSAVCGGGVTLNGSANGTIDGTTVTLTATGTAAMPGAPNCPFTLSGTGTIEDGGYTLRIPFSGTTCLGPVSGVEVMRRPKPQDVVTLGAPTLVSPGPNAHLTVLQPRLTVTNATRNGTVGPAVDYEFQIARDEGFGSMLGSWNVPEQASQTSLDVPQPLDYNGVYFWRGRATDGTPGPWSETRAFQAPAAPAPRPPSAPAAPEGFNWSSVTIIGGSPDVRGWPITSTLTGLRFGGGKIFIDHTKRGQWPGVDIGGALQDSTIWVLFNINGRWYATGGERLRPSQTEKDLSEPSQIGPGWLYAQDRWGVMAGYVPRPGELVGFMITAGSTRADDNAPIKERTGVVLIPFPADHTFASFPAWAWAE